MEDGEPVVLPQPSRMEICDRRLRPSSQTTATDGHSVSRSHWMQPVLRVPVLPFLALESVAIFSFAAYEITPLSF